METPSRHSFNCDGSTRVYPIPSPIKGDNYCRVEVDGVIVDITIKDSSINDFNISSVVLEGLFSPTSKELK